MTGSNGLLGGKGTFLSFKVSGKSAKGRGSLLCALSLMPEINVTIGGDDDTPIAHAWSSITDKVVQQVPGRGSTFLGKLGGSETTLVGPQKAVHARFWKEGVMLMRQYDGSTAVLWKTLANDTVHGNRVRVLEATAAAEKQAAERSHLAAAAAAPAEQEEAQQAHLAAAAAAAPAEQEEAQRAHLAAAAAAAAAATEAVQAAGCARVGDRF